MGEVYKARTRRSSARLGGVWRMLAADGVLQTDSSLLGRLTSFLRLSRGFLVVAAIPAARSFAIRLMSFTGTGLVSGKWTVPFSQLVPPEVVFERREEHP